MTTPALNNWRLDSETGQRVYLYSDGIRRFKDHALTCYPKEACGFLLQGGQFIALDNVAANPEQAFLINDNSYLQYWPILRAIIHSHTSQHHRFIDTRAPSYIDLLTQQSFNLPFLICATDGETVSDPLVFGDHQIHPLLYRQFIHNVTDCWELCRDALELLYFHHYSVNSLLSLFASVPIDAYHIGNVPRHADWFERGDNLFLDHYERLGFVNVGLDHLQPGDMVLMRIESGRPNHAGVYLGDNQLLHHLPGRLSGVASFSRYRRSMTHALRLTHHD